MLYNAMTKTEHSGRNKVCVVCGTVVSPNSPAGLCPRCLLKQGLSETTFNTPPAVDSPSFSVEELQKYLPQLEIIEFIGRGGMGYVYKARQTKLNRLVAVKIIPTVDNTPEFSQRFMQEAQALARMSHPNIVTVYDVGERDRFCYFVMEFVEGKDLKQLISSRSLQPSRALNIAMSICDALQYAHDKGVIHRDIKPGNILIDNSGRVKIADFGLAKITSPGSPDFSLTMSSESMGTPYYMAPEQYASTHTADHRADIYSLGILMYEMLTGELPVGSFQPPSAKVKVDSSVDDIVIRALKTDPSLRYQHARDVLADIERAVSLGFSSAVKKPRNIIFSPVLLTLLISLVAVIGVIITLKHFTRREIPFLPGDAVEFGGNYYKVFFENIGWHEAKRRCEAMGGHLAIVTNRAGDEFLASISRNHVWIGATDESEKGRWSWVDGTAISYSNWDIGEPNNAKDPWTGRGEHYLMISKYAKWNDLSSDSPIIKGFICEWEGSRIAAPQKIRTPEQLHAALKTANVNYNGKGIFETHKGVIEKVTLLHTGVTNISPLRGLPLSYLNISWTDITDLSALENMPLTTIDLANSRIDDISELAGLPLVEVRIDGTRVKDLAPLKGMALNYLDISQTKVTDLAPLAGMPLRELHMNCVKVTDLSPLAGMPLKKIGLLDVPAMDLSPLSKCAELESVVVPDKARKIECLKDLPKLRLLNNKTPDEFWIEHGNSATNHTSAPR